MSYLNIRSFKIPIGITFLSLIILIPFVVDEFISAANGQEKNNQSKNVNTLTGVVKIFHLDAFSDEENGKAICKPLLFTEDGNVIELEFDRSLALPEGGLVALRDQSITVNGKFKSTDMKIFVAHEIETAISIKKLRQLEGAENRPWLAVLCMYPDKSDPLPSVEHFEQLMVDQTYPSVDHFIREISYNRANFEGSQVIGPYTLPLSYARYNFDGSDEDAYPEFHMDIFMHDIIAAIGNDVDFTQFFGFYFITNYRLSCNLEPGYVCAFITGWEINGNPYSTAVFGPWGYSHQTVFAHESIHSYGIVHSSGPYDETYDSQWDIMSASGTCDTGNPSDPLWHVDNGCLGIHTIAWHKFLAGWIDPGRIFSLGSNGAGIINIEKLEFPSLVAGNYLMADIHLPGNQFYTVEYRRQLGYDGIGAIPDEAVIMHYVRPELADRKAQVVDNSDNNNPNDAGAMWLPGETFLSADGVIVHVESMDDEKAVVSLSNQARNPVYANSAYSGYENGTVGAPWNTVVEAYASVTPSGIVYMEPGNYNELFKFAKPCKLMNNGSGMSVFIGQ